MKISLQTRFGLCKNLDIISSSHLNVLQQTSDIVLFPEVTDRCDKRLLFRLSTVQDGGAGSRDEVENHLDNKPAKSAAVTTEVNKMNSVVDTDVVKNMIQVVDNEDEHLKVTQHENQQNDTKIEEIDETREKDEQDEHDNESDEKEEDTKENNKYDLIIEGTGLIESIVACAAARCGRRVLHLDSNDYYGCNSASFPLSDFLTWCRAASSIAAASAAINQSTSVVTAATATATTMATATATATSDTAASGIPIVSAAAMDQPASAAVNNQSTATNIYEHTRRSLLRVIDFQDIKGADDPTLGGHPVVNCTRSSPKAVHPSCHGYFMQRTNPRNNEDSNGGIVDCNGNKGGNDKDNGKDNGKDNVDNNDVTTCHPSFFGYHRHHKMTGARALHHSRKFVIDLSNKVVFSSGQAVNCMVR